MHKTHSINTYVYTCVHMYGFFSFNAMHVSDDILITKLGSRWAHAGLTLGSRWAHAGLTLGSRWAHVGLTLGSRWAHVGRMLGSRWAHAGFTLGSHWAHVGLILGSRWAHAGLMLGSLHGTPCHGERPSRNITLHLGARCRLWRTNPRC